MVNCENVFELLHAKMHTLMPRRQKKKRNAEFYGIGV